MSKIKALLLLFVFPLLWPSLSHALYTELGINYQYKKTTIDSLNDIQQQGTSLTVAFYFWEQIAIEFSYTNSLYVKREKADALPTTTTQRITTQTADVYGIDAIYVLTGKQSQFQPYIKAGAAYLTKRQTVQQDTSSWSVDPLSGWGPGYGIGFKYFITNSVSIRTGWDVVKTPIDRDSFADDLSGRVGISWMF
jgi:outer membrane protein W